MSTILKAGSTLLTRHYLKNVWTSYRTCTGKSSITKSSNSETPAPAVKDILLYRFESPRFFKYLNLFAIVQYGVWTYISISSFSMVNIPVAEMTKEEEKEKPFWRKINFGSDKYKYGLALGSALMGVGILCASWTYILRTVRYLVLRKDQKTVSFVTYTPFGRNRVMDVPLTNISAEGSRVSGTSQMPVKVKGKSLYYLLDLTTGQFIHPELFDKTVGTKRKFI